MSTDLTQIMDRLDSLEKSFKAEIKNSEKRIKNELRTEFRDELKKTEESIRVELKAEIKKSAWKASEKKLRL
jgi:hypothetical protein